MVNKWVAITKLSIFDHKIKIIAVRYEVPEMFCTLHSTPWNGGGDQKAIFYFGKDCWIVAMVTK